MTLEERLKLYDMVHGLNDRVLYLAENDKAKFMKAIEKIYETYPCPREVRYGSQARVKHGEEV
jgi:hypothetical protein